MPRIAQGDTAGTLTLVPEAWGPSGPDANVQPPFHVQVPHAQNRLCNLPDGPDSGGKMLLVWADNSVQVRGLFLAVKTVGLAFVLNL